MTVQSALAFYRESHHYEFFGELSCGYKSIVLLSTNFQLYRCYQLKNWKKIKIALDINPKGKSILSPQEQRQGPRFKVSSERLSTEIDILIQSPI